VRRVSVDDVEPRALGDASERRDLAAPLGATGFAVNRYRVAPGEGFPAGLHAHADQEEVFVVLAGEATFETLDGEVTVGAGEAVRFVPGEFQTGRNDGTVALVALALGAPRESEDVRVPRTCPKCDRGDVRVAGGEDGVAFVWPDCGAERSPAPCPDCRGGDLRFTVTRGGGRSDGGGESEREPVVVCPDCGLELDDAPLDV